MIIQMQSKYLFEIQNKIKQKKNNKLCHSIGPSRYISFDRI